MSLPLSALLSQLLVAFTIEFDNEFEHQTPHRTTNHGSTAGSRGGPWLASLVMWTNCMQFVGEDGVRVGELEVLARTPTNLNGMERWGYVSIQPDPDDRRPKPPRSAWVIRATAKGRKAQEVWRPLFGVIEKRWEERFGEDEINRLRDSLSSLVGQLDIDLPDCLPILGYGLFSKVPDRKRTPTGGRQLSSVTLATLLSRVLLAFAIEFERESDLSLAISANVLRVLSESGVRVRDLPLLTGVSKEAISMAMGILQKKGVAVVEPDPAGSRAKVARLTSTGRKAQQTYEQLLGAIEERWQARSGRENIRTLRELLERLAREPRRNRTRMAGERLFPNPARCRTIRWCCIAAGSPMAAESRQFQSIAPDRYGLAGDLRIPCRDLRGWNHPDPDDRKNGRLRTAFPRELLRQHPGRA